MNVLLLSTSDGRHGGYAAAFRLLEGLESAGISPRMLVARKSRDHESIIGGTSKLAGKLSTLRARLDQLPLIFYPAREPIIFSPACLPDKLPAKIGGLNPDLIHLHWINEGFLSIESLKKIKKPIVWTLHDMWSFTGGCHYNNECERYRDECGSCPQLGSQKHEDLSCRVLKRKQEAWKSLDMTIVTPSRWLAESARSSALFQNRRIEVIPYGLDTERFKPKEKIEAREYWNLPKDKKLILFGAMSATSDKRKGFHFLLPALGILKEEIGAEEIELVIFGTKKPEVALNLGFKAHYPGEIKSDKMMASLYSAVDLFVAPSMQDNLPLTIMESLACGTPVTAFDVGGIPDMVDHKINGYLASPFDTEALAKGIQWVISDSEKIKKLGQAAREKVVNQYDLIKQAKRYIDLYEELI